MADDDLIRRGDALDAVAAALGKSGGNDEFGNMMQEVILQNEDDQEAIATLPAQGVRVKPLVWTRADEDDGVPQWVSGRYFVRYTATGYKLRINGIEMPKRYLGNDADERAKADADKDHAARILAALAPAEAGGVEAQERAKALTELAQADAPLIDLEPYVNETPKIEHDAGNVLTTAPLPPAVLAELPEVRALVLDTLERAMVLCQIEADKGTKNGQTSYHLGAVACRNAIAAIREGKKP